MKGFLGRVLQIEPEEWPATLLALSSAFLTLFAAVFSRTVADAMFLAEFDASWVPTYIAAGALGSVVFSAIYVGIVRKGKLGARRNAMALFGLAVCAFVAAAFGSTGGELGTWVFGVGMVLIGPAVNTVAWNVLTGIFTGRQSKRLLPLVGAAATLGAIAGGLSVRALSKSPGVTALMFPSAAIFLLLVPLPLRAFRYTSTSDALAKGKGRTKTEANPGFLENLLGGLHALKDSPLVASLAGITFLLAIATNLVDVTFLTAVKGMVGKGDEIGSFLGLFHAVTNGAVLLLQTLVLGRLFARFGVRWVFLLYPGVLIAGAGVVAIWPLFYVVASYRGVDKVLKFTGHYGGMDLILSPVSEEVRDRARAFLRGGCNPAGALLAGMAATPIAAFAETYDPTPVLMAGIGLSSALALALAIKLRRQYVDELRKALRIREVRQDASPSVKMTMDGDVARILTEAMDTGDDYLRNFALDILAENLRDASLLQRMLRHRDAKVRRAAMDSVAARPQRALGRAAQAYLAQGGEREPTVIAAGLRAVRATLGSWPGGVPQEFMRHGSHEVQAEALVLAMEASEPEAQALMDETIGRWASSEQTEERRGAALLLYELATSGMLGGHRPLLDALLQDPETVVRLEAVRAAGPLGDNEMVRRLVEMLKERSVRATAEAALGQLGSRAARPLLKTIMDDDEDWAVRHSAVHALSRIRHSDALWAAGEVLSLPDAGIRTQAAATIRTLRRLVGDGAVPRDRITNAMREELSAGYRAAGLWNERFRSGLPTEPLLDDALNHEIQGATEALFGLTGALYGADWVEIALSRYQTGSARVQADAVEVLDMLSTDATSRDMLDFLDLSSHEAKARKARDFLGMLSQETFTGAVLAAPDRHLARCLVRAGLPEGITPLPDLAQEVEEMSDQFERVLLLKSVGLFSELSGEDLLPVAEVAEEVVAEAGQEIVHQGELGDELFVISTGRVHVEKDGVKLTELGDKGCFGELAVLDREPRAATVRAVRTTELLRIGRQEINDLMDAHPALTRGIMKVLLGYVRKTKKPKGTFAGAAPAADSPSAG